MLRRAAASRFVSIPVSQSIIARSQAVAMDEIGNPQGGEAGIVAAAPR